MQPVAFITLLLQSMQIVPQSFNVEDGGIVSCAEGGESSCTSYFVFGFRTHPAFCCKDKFSLKEGRLLC